MSLTSIITKGLGGFAKWLTTSQFGVNPADETPKPPPQVPGNGIFTKPWGPLITGGLGTSACCGLIIGGLGSFSCFVGITPPPNPGTGGGSVAIHPGVMVPWPTNLKRKPNTRAIVVTVRMKDKKWTKNYLIPERRTKLAVSVIRILNVTTSKVSVGVSAVSRASKRVVATIVDR